MKKQLRIHKQLNINSGRADKTRKGQREVHMILKFDSEEEYETFKNELKAWYYAENDTKTNPPEVPGKDKDFYKNELDKAGIKYHPNIGLEKLKLKYDEHFTDPA